MISTWCLYCIFVDASLSGIARTAVCILFCVLRSMPFRTEWCQLSDACQVLDTVLELTWHTGAIRDVEPPSIYGILMSTVQYTICVIVCTSLVSVGVYTVCIRCTYLCFSGKIVHVPLVGASGPFFFFCTDLSSDQTETGHTPHHGCCLCPFSQSNTST